jgi:hypothetical protein
MNSPLKQKGTIKQRAAAARFLQHQTVLVISKQGKYISFYRCLGSRNLPNWEQSGSGTLVPLLLNNISFGRNKS